MVYRGSIYHEYGGQNTMDREPIFHGYREQYSGEGIKVSWVEGSICHMSGFKMSWVGGQNTIGRGSIYLG
jgi:hypothetical protein